MWLSRQRALLQPVPGLAALQRCQPKDLPDAAQCFLAGCMLSLTKRTRCRRGGRVDVPLKLLRRGTQVLCRIGSPGCGGRLCLCHGLCRAAESTEAVAIADLVGGPEMHRRFLERRQLASRVSLTRRLQLLDAGVAVRRELV